ncbi:MAG: hypothetical protein WD206_04205 [Actinomycetota bacterium]
MSSGKKKRRDDFRAPQHGSSDRSDPGPAGRTQRPGGFLGGLFGRGVAPSQSPYPTLRQSFGRGFLAVGSSPVLVGVAVVAPFLAWSVFLVLGMVPSIGNMAGYLALPSIGVSTDIVAGNLVFGARGGSLAAPVLIALRAVMTALLSGMVVEQLRFGRVSGRGLRDGVRAIPVSLAISILAFTATLLINIVGSFGLGIAFSLLMLVASVFFLSYGPVIAVVHPRGIGPAIRRTLLAARVPGSQNLLLAFAYALFAFVSPLLVPGLGRIDANPGISTWIGVLAVNVIHLGFLAVYSYRYLYAAPGLPEPKPPQQRAQRRSAS